MIGIASVTHFWFSLAVCETLCAVRGTRRSLLHQRRKRDFGPSNAMHTRNDCSRACDPWRGWENLSEKRVVAARAYGNK